MRKPVSLLLAFAMLFSLMSFLAGFVTAENRGDTLNLRRFVSDVTIFDMDGGEIDPEADVLFIDNTYKFAIDFELEYYPDAELIYRLPSQLKNPIVSVSDANADITLDEYGLVTVRFGGGSASAPPQQDNDCEEDCICDDCVYADQPDDPDGCENCEEVCDCDQAAECEECGEEECDCEQPGTVVLSDVSEVCENCNNPENECECDDATTDNSDDDTALYNFFAPMALSIIPLDDDINGAAVSFTIEVDAQLEEGLHELDFGNGFEIIVVVLDPDGEFEGITPLAAGYSWDLSEFVTTVQMTDMDGTPILSTDPTFIGQTYRFVIQFDESYTLQLEYTSAANAPPPGAGLGVLVYQLPGFLNIQAPVDVTPLFGPAPANAKIGQYTISTAGLVQVWFDNVDLQGNPLGSVNLIDNYSDVTIVLEIFAQLMGSDDGNLDFGNGIVVGIDPPQRPPATLTMNKQSRYDPANNRIYYMLIITALGPVGTEISNIILDDTPAINGFAGNINNPLTNNAFLGFTFQVNRAYGMPGTLFAMDGGPAGGGWPAINWTSENPANFTYDFTNSNPAIGNLVLNPEDFIVIRYHVELPQLIENNSPAPIPNLYVYDFTVNNTAAVTGEDEGGNSLGPVTDTTVDHVKKELVMEKNGVVQPGNNILWTVTIGDGSSVILNDGTITDTHTGGLLTFPPANEIEITFYGSGGTSVTYTLDNLPVGSLLSGPATGFEFEVPDDSFFLTTLPPNGYVYQIVIIYTTSIAPPPIEGEPSAVYRNDVVFTWPDGTPGPGTGGSVTVNPPQRVVMTKATSGICGQPGSQQGPNNESYWVDYTVTVQVPPSLDGQILYLYDNLGILPGGAGVPNVPVLRPGDTTFAEVSGPGAGGATLYYSQFIPNTGNSWRLYFGTSAVDNAASTPAAADAVWQFSDAVTLTVSYRIWLSDATVNTLRDKTTARQLSNAVYLINSGTTSIQPPDLSSGIGGNSVGGYNINDSWPIIKRAQSTGNPRLFNYTVTLKGGFTPSRPLFAPGSTPIFTDTFDPMMEFVPGSLSIMRGAATFTPPASAITIGANSFSVDLTNPADPSWFNQSVDYTVNFQLQYIGPALPPPPASQVVAGLTNTARIEVNAPNACVFEDTATVDYTQQMLAKSMTPDGDRVHVEIIINADGSTDFGAPPTPGPSVIAARDTLANLALFVDTVVFQTQTQLPDGSWNGVWINQPKGVDNSGALWSVNIISSTEIDFIIPNRTPVKIIYDARVTLAPGTPGTISNSIEIAGVSDGDSQTGYVVGGGGIGVGAGRLPLTVYKRDPAGNNLRDASFSLYVVALPTDVTLGANYPRPVGLVPPTTAQLANTPELSNIPANLNFGFLGTQTTDVNGIAVFDTQRTQYEWINSSQRLLYMLVEEQSPYGYMAINPLTFFTISSRITDAEIAILNTLLTPALLPGQSIDQITDFITIENVLDHLADPGTLRIRKEFIGLRDAQIPQNFEIVIRGPGNAADPNWVDTGIPNIREYTIDRSEVLTARSNNPVGITLQDLAAGTYFINEENHENVPGFNLTTTPPLPIRINMDGPTEPGVVIRIDNTYTQIPPITPMPPPTIGPPDRERPWIPWIPWVPPPPEPIAPPPPPNVNFNPPTGRAHGR